MIYTSIIKSNLQITELAPNFIELNNKLKLPSPLLLLRNNVYVLNINNPNEIFSSCFDILIRRIPKVDYIIIGTGKKKVYMEDNIMDFIDNYDVQVDILPSFEASSSFNMCSENELNVACFIFGY